jgi:hypothetical protein
VKTFWTKLVLSKPKLPKQSAWTDDLTRCNIQELLANVLCHTKLQDLVKGNTDIVSFWDAMSSGTGGPSATVFCPEEDASHPTTPSTRYYKVTPNKTIILLSNSTFHHLRLLLRNNSSPSFLYYFTQHVLHRERARVHCYTRTQAPATPLAKRTAN